MYSTRFVAFDTQKPNELLLGLYDGLDDSNLDMMRFMKVLDLMTVFTGKEVGRWCSSVIEMHLGSRTSQYEQCREDKLANN